MSNFDEAADALRAAQLQRLESLLNAEREAHKVMQQLAMDRGDRLVELARVANELKDERDRLVADSRRLKWLCEGRHYIEYSPNLNAYYVVTPRGDCQVGVFDTPEAAIDDMMESENV